MKKVLVVITTKFVRTGGLTSVMMNYWRAIDKSNISFDFASTNTIDNQLNAEISEYKSRYFKLPPRNHPLSYIKNLSSISKSYDIVHVHANSATSVIELFAAWIAGVPMRIHHNHTSRTHYPILNRILHPLFVHLYTNAVACSDAAGDWLFGKGNYTILPNAVDLEEYEYSPSSRKLIRDELGINQGDFVIGHIGKFMDAKNHDFLIKVFAQYHQTHPSSKLVLVGDGAWRSKIEKWRDESGCAQAIILAGLRSDISAIIQIFDVFVFPSLYEGFPLTVIEAQASGLPCLVSSNVTSKVKIGLDVVMKNLEDGIDKWSEAIDEFDYSFPREERTRKNFKLITEAHFNIKHEANNLLMLYNK